jgi:hypothetical protein
MYTVPYGAFSNITSVKRLEITCDLRYVADYAFYHMINLVDYKVVEDSDYRNEIGLPDTIVGIGNYAFAECYKLPYVILPHDLETLGNYVFKNDIVLREVHISRNDADNYSNSIKSIGQGLLDGCESLETLTIPFVGKTKNSSGDEAVLGWLFSQELTSEFRTEADLTDSLDLFYEVFHQAIEETIALQKQCGIDIISKYGKKED